jgi:hypothetical protein
MSCQARATDGSIHNGHRSTRLPQSIECLQCYVHPQIADVPGPGGWSLIRSINAPARVQYGAACSAATAVVLLNNFDYRNGHRRGDHLSQRTQSHRCRKARCGDHSPVERLAAKAFDGPVSRLRSGAVVRSWGVPPFRIYYPRHREELLILRVYHQKRRPITR